MYDLLLSIHNLLRWAFLAAALYAIFKAARGLSGGTPFAKPDNLAGTLLLSAAHSQLLIGLILLFVSPNIQHAMANMAVAMKDSAIRAMLIEHPLMMIISVALIQIGRIRVKKAYSDADKHKRSLIFFGIALVLVLSRIPWGAPMFRF
ncbi:MAG: hypothetical protein SGJ00_12720 [bacterium]|nr:hypothetical protein [bacterium]